MLQEASSICDHLIVGLNADPSLDYPKKNKPIQTLMERQIQISAVKYVDQFFVYNTEDELYHLLVALPIDVRIVGADYQTKKFTGDDLGTEIYYNKRDHNWSSSRIRKRILESCENK